MLRSLPFSWASLRGARLVPVFLAVLCCADLAKGQTLIINEMSNGPSGSKEFVEMLVIPTTPPEPCTPTQCLDIRGWIIDDNNGYHAPGSGVGIAPGAFRFSPSAAIWSCVPVGTLIVVYNSGDLNAALPPDDVSLSDGNCVIVAPVAGPLFESTGITPQGTLCSGDPGGWGPGGSWLGNVALANTGDCFRIADAAGCEVFSVCYGNVSLNPLIYFSGAGTADEWYFNDGDPYAQANWVQSCTSGCETPGSPNSPANAACIAALNNGCQPIVPLAVTATTTATCSCDGTATAAPTGAAGPYTYLWFDAAWTALGQTGITATSLCAGDYHVQVTSAGGCIDTADVQVPQLPGPDAGTDGAVALCPGDAAIDLFAQLGGTPDAGGVWSPSLTFGTGVFDPALDLAGTYTYTLTGGSCPPASADVMVTVGTPPAVTIALDSISCNGVADGGVEALAQGIGPFTFTWDQALGDGPVHGGLGAGTYTVTVTGDGCQASASANLVEPPPIALTMSASTASCGGANGSACASASGGTGTLGYAWDAGASTATCYDPVGPGLHTVDVTDLHGCIATASIAVEDSVPEVIIEALPVSCFGAEDGSIQLSLPAAPIEAFGWTGPGAFTSTDEDLTGLVPGLYTYSWTDMNGCSLNGTVEITSPSELQLIITVTPESCLGACDGALDAALVNGIAPPAFSLDPPAWSGGHFGGLCGGVYTMHAVDGHGCTIELQAEVPDGPEGANAAILPVDPLCVYDAPILLQSVDAGGTWSGPGIVDPATGLFDPSVAGVGEASIVHEMDGSCNGPGTLLIMVVAPPAAAFDVDLHGPVGVEMIVDATNRTAGAAVFRWTLDGVFIAGTTDLEHHLDAIDASLHTLCLIAIDDAGCADTLCRTITAVDTTEIFVPNSFTPNGDGFNEVFGVVVRGLEPAEGSLQVFDRWGELVFEGEGLSRARWDGKYKGREVGPEVFIWRVAYRDPASHREISRIGHVTLLR